MRSSFRVLGLSEVSTGSRPSGQTVLEAFLVQLLLGVGAWPQMGENQNTNAAPTLFSESHESRLADRLTRGDNTTLRLHLKGIKVLSHQQGPRSNEVFSLTVSAICEFGIQPATQVPERSRRGILNKLLKKKCILEFILSP